MLYSEYITKAKSICISISDNNGIAYLLPDYKYILYLAGLNLTDVSDFPNVTMDDVGENLRLEVEAYNKQNENLRPFIERIEELIASIVVPLQTTDQNDIVQYLLSQVNFPANKPDTKQQEEQLPNQNNEIIKMQNYINFKKKEID